MGMRYLVMATIMLVTGCEGMASTYPSVELTGAIPMWARFYDKWHADVAPFEAMIISEPAVDLSESKALCSGNGWELISPLQWMTIESVAAQQLVPLPAGFQRAPFEWVSAQLWGDTPPSTTWVIDAAGNLIDKDPQLPFNYRCSRAPRS